MKEKACQYSTLSTLESQLDQEVTNYLDKATKNSSESLPIKGIRAIIGP